MNCSSNFDWFIDKLHNTFDRLPDYRSFSPALTYEVKNAVLGAFSMFFSQSASFLSYQNSMKQAKGKSNAESLFKIEKIPSDNQIRNILDGVSPDNFYSVFSDCYSKIEESGHLGGYRFFQDCLLVAIDGTEYFRSSKIHCKNCTVTHHKNGKVSYSHKVLTPVITQPSSTTVIPLEPEFVIPQDGSKKQDCELNAAKRWIERNAHMADEKSIILGDDLFSREPFCKQLLLKGFHFILVCKPDSHKTLYEYLDGFIKSNDVSSISSRRWNGKYHEKIILRYFNNLPVKDGENVLHVNWADITITNTKTQETCYYNSFITDFIIDDSNVEQIIQAGRARWKVENENNNVLKTKGYHLEHNYGHGKKFLSSTLLTLNLLAFLSHIFLEFMDKTYFSVRKALSVRKIFFHDFKALTKYLYFDNWKHLINFMAEQLELNITDIKMNSG
ncbi:conserved uncharacterized protein [Desulfobacula toluolica Tol2]|uniref:Conserved uncharacterized protein n=1 Tax=Desulfobacula toluolica (strain DSM 7467 / Tol2) TaxID=651182 RepID=K0NLY8_DESTT|nr:conserved uncharacterized protein [Desulfobacula toluolica Tol2]